MLITRFAYITNPRCICVSEKIHDVINNTCIDNECYAHRMNNLRAFPSIRWSGRSETEAVIYNGEGSGFDPLSLAASQDLRQHFWPSTPQSRQTDKQTAQATSVALQQGNAGGYLAGLWPAQKLWSRQDESANSFRRGEIFTPSIF